MPIPSTSTTTDLEREYRNMYDTYTRIFTRLGLKFRAVFADTGAIGGSGSHEFHVLADSGEDAIAFCPDLGLRGERGTGRSGRPGESRRWPARRPWRRRPPRTRPDARTWRPFSACR
jgi:hypothetical protein